MGRLRSIYKDRRSGVGQNKASGHYRTEVVTRDGLTVLDQDQHLRMCDLYNKQINSFTPRKSRINSTAGSFLLLNISLLFILMVNIYPY